jgi:hypothetical protein
LYKLGALFQNLAIASFIGGMIVVFINDGPFSTWQPLDQATVVWLSLGAIIFGVLGWALKEASEAEPKKQAEPKNQAEPRK